MKQTIIKSLLCTVMALLCLTASAQVKEFEKYADTKNVTYVYISKYMIGMVGKMANMPGVDVSSLSNKLSAIQIITSDDRDAGKKLKKEVQGILSSGKYEKLMQVNEDNSKVNIYHSEGKQQSAVVMVTDGDGTVTVVVFSGKFNMDDVMKMTKKG
jgi:transcription antitermination factor NusA-like protein